MRRDDQSWVDLVFFTILPAAIVIGGLALLFLWSR